MGHGLSAAIAIPTPPTTRFSVALPAMHTTRQIWTIRTAEFPDIHITAMLVIIVILREAAAVKR